jgi:hypothetical protein
LTSLLDNLSELFFYQALSSVKSVAESKFVLMSSRALSIMISILLVHSEFLDTSESKYLLVNTGYTSNI